MSGRAGHWLVKSVQFAKLAAMSESIGIIGAGAWGTALAHSLAKAGCSCLLWVRETDVLHAIQTLRENTFFLPTIKLHDSLRVTNDLSATCAADVLLLAVPAQFMRATAQSIAGLKIPSRPLVVCAKGIEQNSLYLMSEVLAEELPGWPAVILSGPTFALEVAQGLPTAITLAGQETSLVQALIQSLGHNGLRPYASDDVVGVQLGGALKNVLAIACGIVEGRGLGDNGRAAIITRGLAEMARLGVACGGRAETFMGLSGIGDLVLTCCGQLSRNMTLGYALGQGKPLAAVLAERRSVAEGVYTAAAAVALAAKKNIDVPIAAAVDGILNNNASIDASIQALLARPFKQERG